MHKNVVKFDGVIIETTRLAVPASFLVYEHIRQLYEFDLIVAVVDTNQDIVLLDKNDLVPEELKNIEGRIRDRASMCRSSSARASSTFSSSLDTKPLYNLRDTLFRSKIDRRDAKLLFGVELLPVKVRQSESLSEVVFDVDADALLFCRRRGREKR